MKAPIVIAGIVLLLLAGKSRGITRMYIDPKNNPTQNRAILAPHIARAESANGIPAGMLTRLLQTESAFRSDIITGAFKSSAGAVGIAQIVPKWHPNVNPLDPLASIDYAAKYLASLYKRFGAWDKAAAAYNWGQGNLGKTITRYGDEWASHLPTETKNYIQKVTA